MTSTVRVPERWEARADVAALRAEVLQLATLATAGLSFLGMWAMLVAPVAFGSAWEASALAALGLGGTATVAHLAQRRGEAASGLLLLAGLTLTLAGLLHVYPWPVIAPWLSVIVLGAAALLGRGAGFVAALVVTAILATAPADQGGGLWGATGISTLALIWVTASLAWLTSYPIYRALGWAWSSYADALEKTQELRERQGELNRALKSLEESYERLEQVSVELERARESAEQARQLKVEFAANISHELRTPLNLIVGFADMISGVPEAYSGEVLPVVYRGDVEAIQRNAAHLSSLIDDVLDLSQLDAGRMGLSKEWTTLAVVAGEAARAVEALFTRKGLWLRVEVSDDLPPIYADRARLREVFINLLSNAARFTDRGGATVAAGLREGEALVSITDTGIGIARDDLPKVFEEFRQLDQSTRRAHGGTGLGLAISKHFVELHGGAMWVESQVGRGTTFSFSLPLCQNVASLPLRRDWQTWARPPADPEPRIPTLLVLDDDPGAVRLFQRHLDGFQVLAAADADEAARLLAGGPVAAIVATGSGALSGEERLRGLRGAPEGVPLIACSLPGRRQASAQMGVVDYLLKPISRERLAATLARLGPRVRRVLVADDEPDMVRLLSQMIHAASPRYRVLRAYDGAQALAMLRDRRPDVVILDLSMPGVDGHRVLAEVQELPEPTRPPVVVLTARDYDPLGAECGITRITREGGLGLEDMMACLRGALGGLVSSPAPRSAPAPATTAAD